MPEPSILFRCGACDRVESLPIDTLQLIGEHPFLNADGWRVGRDAPYPCRCADCWEKKPLVPDDLVETIRVRPREGV